MTHDVTPRDGGGWERPPRFAAVATERAGVCPRVLVCGCVGACVCVCVCVRAGVRAYVREREIACALRVCACALNVPAFPEEINS